MDWLFPVMTALLLVLTTLSFVLWVRDVRHFRRQRMLSARIQTYTLPTKRTLDDLDQPFYERVIQPWLTRQSRRWVRILAPQAVKQDLTRRLRQAGFSWSPEQYLLLRLGSTLVMVLLGLMLDMAGMGNSFAMAVIWPVGLGSITYLYWGVHVSTRSQMRLAQLEQALPEVFDILSMSVEAGLAFDGALQKLVSYLPVGVAREEFGRVLSDVQLGMTRSESLMALAERTRSRELKRFAGLVLQAERTGGGMVETLRAQSREIKQARAALARERAALLPVKMLFPMVGFIFPAILIVILGPAVIEIARVFH
ncbi:Type II secretion system F domain protein [Sulfobacillus acidophilus TPY]|uniref:Type II secretion system F domain protein n=1 Tax=Sulfobacillus acidophilus (strain ATCC 700253 / DSM 10332 / NAL) TaxID=679936 RepID=G8TS02_SULAD|nr:Type II secretion system F domain protein [Sulfobacillus acidophilus TPY]AEW04328.1 Type II secretion system F domain protein [Sulfobacillus acidophilus DSM 10332]